MKIIIARLVKSKTDDGLWEMQDHIELGKAYFVDVDSIQVIKAFHKEKKIFHERKMILDIEVGKWIPLEFLDLNENNIP